MPTNVDKYFVYDHLPQHLQLVSAPIGDLAAVLDKFLPDGSEKSAGMRKLLEAKDCFVRAALERDDNLGESQVAETPAAACRVAEPECESCE